MPSTRLRTSARRLLAAASVLALLLVGVPAHANPGPIGATPRVGPNTDLVMIGTGPGRGVTGAIGPAGTPSDPTQSYPTSIPAGFAPLNEGFAGIIRAQSTETPEILNMYCIDIRTSTYSGIGYENGTWDDSNVPNVGYIARILEEYYPNTGEPAAATDVNQRAAAVQAAIWYFSDNYVLQPDDPTRTYTAAIVNAVVAAGALPEPSPPALVIDPTSSTGPPDTPLGPYTVTSDSDDPNLEITVRVAGGTMYADAAGTEPIANGDTVANGAQIWLLPDDALDGGTVTLTARGVATAPSGNVYLYDGNTPGVDDAQRLILAEDAEVSTLVAATADFLRAGALRVTKTIAGGAAGDQGEVTLHVSCADGDFEQDITIAANTPAGDTSTLIQDLPVGISCTVTEPSNGSSAGVSVTTSIVGSPATITAEEVGVDVTNTYETVLSSLVVTKTIAGGAAGDQGAVTLHVSCDNDLEQDINIPANAPAGDTATTIENLPVGTVCTVTEPQDGSSAGVSVTTTYEGSPATITAEEVGVDVTNTYETPSTPYTPPDTDDETSTSSQSDEDLASTGAAAGIGLMAALGVALIVGAGTLLSASHRRHKTK